MSYENNNTVRQPRVTSFSGVIVPESKLPSVGVHREPINVMLWGIFTFGLYAVWWAFKYTREIKRALGRADLTPTRDLLLTIVTGGLYGLYAYGWKYPKLIKELQLIVGLPVHDCARQVLLLNLTGLNMVSLFVVQSELNKVWQASLIGGKESAKD